MSDVNRLKARIKEYFCKVIDESEEGFMSKEEKNVLTYNKDLQKMIDEELAKEPQECKWIPCSERMPEEHDTAFTKYKGTEKWNDLMFAKASNEVLVTAKFEDGTTKSFTMRTFDGK